MKSLVASLQFISALPLGKPRPFDPKGIIAAFPLAGLVIGLALALFDTVASALWSTAIAGALDAVLLVLLTGGLHLDGLADTADGLYGGGERNTALAIMKDSRVGAMGLIVVICVLLLKATCMAQLDAHRFLALVTVPAYARIAMMVAIRFLPYARGREGIGSAFFEAPLSGADFKWALVPLLLSLLMGWRGILLNLVFLFLVGALLFLYKKKIGGITGDMLGCMVEVTEPALFLCMAVGGHA